MSISLEVGIVAERGRANGRGTTELPSIFDICTPRKDIRDGLVESELAADLSQVAGGGGEVPRILRPGQVLCEHVSHQGDKGSPAQRADEAQGPKLVHHILA